MKIVGRHFANKILILFMVVLCMYLEMDAHPPKKYSMNSYAPLHQTEFE